MTGRAGESDRLYEAFLAVVSLPPDEWEGALERLGDGDPVLLEQLRSLLENHRALPADDRAPGVVPMQLLEEALAASGTAPWIDDQPLALVGNELAGRWLVKEHRGSGASGHVFAAWDTELELLTAVKILRPSATGTDALGQLRDELRVLAEVNHPNIVQWRHFERPTDGPPFIVMDYVPGQELEDLLVGLEGSRRRLPEHEASGILLQVLRALAAAHRPGPTSKAILHLDLKPANVMVQHTPDEGYLAKVIDFSVSQTIGAEALAARSDPTQGHPLDGDPSASMSTLAWTRLSSTNVRRIRGGTPLYASPEQCAHLAGEDRIEELDGRSDLYSFGIMAYRMLAGELPFERPRSRGEALELHQQGNVRRLADKDEGPSGRLCRFVDRCTAHDRDKRWADSSAALAELEAICHPPSRRGLRLSLGVSVVLLIALVVAVIQPGGDPPPVVIETSGEPVHLGPARPHVDLGWPDDGASGEPESLVVILAGASAVESLDWQALPLPGGRLRLSPPTSLLIADAVWRGNLVIEAQGTGRRSEPLSVVVIGEGSWELAAPVVAGLGERELDPVGAVLSVPLQGDGAELVAGVTVGEDDLAVAAARPSEATVWDAPLDGWAGAGSGPVTFTVTAVDRADRVVERAVVLPLMYEPLVLDDLDLWPCVSVGGREMITPAEQDPVLHVGLSHAANIHVAVRDAESGVVHEWRSALESASTQLPFSTMGLTVDELPTEGSLHVTVEDHDHVFRTVERRDTVGRDEGVRHFRSFSGQPEFALELLGAGGPRRMAPIEWSTDTPVVSLRRLNDVPLVVRWELNADADPRTVTRGLVALTTLDRDRLATGVEPWPDGRHHLVVSALVASRWDQEIELDDAIWESDGVIREKRVVVVDREPAQLAILSLREDPVASNRIDVTVVVGDDARLAAGAPARDFVCRAWREEAPDRVAVLGDGARALQPLGIEHLSLQAPWAGAGLDTDPDGTWILEVTGRDAAGHGIEARRALTVSRHGPQLDLLNLEADGLWPREAPGRWPLRIRATDRNGVATVLAEVRSRDGDGPSPIAVELSPETPGGNIWVGVASLSQEWSRRGVEVRVEAFDGEGTAAPEVALAVHVDVIDPPHPSRVRVADGRVSSMALIPTNPETYLLGGRSDGEENALFASLGLSSFDGGVPGELAWALTIPPGALPAYYLDDCEVSVGQYRDFLEDPVGYRHPAWWSTGEAPSAARREALARRLDTRPVDLPVTGVTWPEAAAYAAYVDKQLPSLLQWEYALRGGTSYRATATGQALVGPHRVQPVRQGVDVTPMTRLYGLGSNVSEWTATPETRPSQEQPRQRDRVRVAAEVGTQLAPWGLAPAGRYWVAGGSTDMAEATQFFVRRWVHRGVVDDTIGFRCAAPADRVLDILNGRREARLAWNTDTHGVEPEESR